MRDTSEYDFIVVGAGSAGSVVATRLSEDPAARVLALEAGGTDIPENVLNPSVWYTLFGSAVDWGYQSVPQPGLGGRQTYEPRGKLAGGTSNLYIMMHIRGHPADYDNWAYNGCPGWRFAGRPAVLPEARASGGRHQSAGRQGRSALGVKRTPPQSQSDIRGFHCGLPAAGLSHRRRTSTVRRWRASAGTI